jgi:hypothetical protein
MGFDVCQIICYVTHMASIIYFLKMIEIHMLSFFLFK